MEETQDPGYMPLADFEDEEDAEEVAEGAEDTDARLSGNKPSEDEIRQHNVPTVFHINSSEAISQEWAKVISEEQWLPQVVILSEMDNGERDNASTPPLAGQMS
ncbi:hypothetical protein HDU96_000974 [Phlyctochytrium bullatum]|nr:hypothetical protein HDU96_000974 [Phlyctochytrium bullatum]